MNADDVKAVRHARHLLEQRLDAALTTAANRADALAEERPRAAAYARSRMDTTVPELAEALTDLLEAIAAAQAPTIVDEPDDDTDTDQADEDLDDDHDDQVPQDAESCGP